MLIDTEREAHALDSPSCGRPVSRLRSEQDPIGPELSDAHQHPLLAEMQQSMHNAVSPAGQAVPTE
jgi:hypothetical protein